MKRTDGDIQATTVSLFFLAFACSLLAAESEKKTPPTTPNARDGAEMILIPGGRFLMGSTKAEVDAQFRDAGLPEDWKKHTLDEEPRHERTLKPFYIYKYEVTNEQYQAFLDSTGHRAPPHWKGKTYPVGKGKHPVVEVSWDDAQAYCRWAGTQLPTEAQWEYAARGSQPAEGKPSRVYPWGDRWDRRLSNNASYHAGKELQNAEDWNKWYKGDQKAHFPLTSPVGSFPQSVSPFGVHDMAGNAWEWCAEIQAPYPDQRPEDAPDKRLRARRGGSWANVALHIRTADRQPAAHDDLNLYTGFRCVKNP
jgi:formylglycine-generating enzyme required for sulfatase activity